MDLLLFILGGSIHFRTFLFYPGQRAVFANTVAH